MKESYRFGEVQKPFGTSRGVGKNYKYISCEGYSTNDNLFDIRTSAFHLQLHKTILWTPLTYEIDKQRLMWSGKWNLSSTAQQGIGHATTIIAMFIPHCTNRIRTMLSLSLKSLRQWLTVTCSSPFAYKLRSHALGSMWTKLAALNRTTRNHFTNNSHSGNSAVSLFAC